MSCPAGSSYETCQPGTWGEASEDMKADAAVAQAGASWLVASCRLGILDGGSNATTGDSATTSAAVLPEDCAAAAVFFASPAAAIFSFSFFISSLDSARRLFLRNEQE